MWMVFCAACGAIILKPSEAGKVARISHKELAMHETFLPVNL